MHVQAAEYRIGRARVRSASRELIIDGEPTKLGARAFDLLLALIERRDRIVSKSELLDVVWPGLVVEENNLQVQVLALRKLLGQQSIATVPARGYRLVAEVLTDRVNAHTERPTDALSSDAAMTESRGPERPVIPSLPIHLIGRDGDLAALDALADVHRLVTIVGPGGVGKTRLAQVLATRRGLRFADGAVWVDLAAVTAPGVVPAAVATAVRAPLVSGDEALGALVEALKRRAVLIVLDNAEHLVEATARLVQRLMDDTSNVAFLITSQAPLRIAGEQLYRLGALQLPLPGSTPAEALACSAVALFIERAAANARGVQFTDDDLANIGEVCRHLDGLPLAIELAAARAARLGLPALVRNIDQWFRMLGSGSRTAPVRQQTLAAALDWSHDLLTTDAQTVFRRLAVFSGSFTLDAARELVADAQIDEWSVVEQLAELIDRSLVAVDDPSATRYRLLDTARAFALEKLQASGELSSLQQRHGLSMARLADRCFDEFWDIGDSELLGRYVPDLDNLRAALHRTRDEPPTFARLASGLLPLLRRLSLMREAFSLAQEASALPEQTLQRDTLARLRLAIALVTYKHDDALRALELLRQTGDDRGVCLALHAIVHQKSLDKEEIAAACEEVRRLRQDNWTLKRQALGLSTEGWTALRCGNLTQAVDLYRKAIRYSDAAGADDAGTALRMQQYYVTIASGDLEAASKDAEDVLARCHALKNAYRLTCTQAAIVHLRLALGRIDSARELTAEFASFDRALGWPHACDIADALALLAASCDRVEDGARLAGFADKVNLERRGDASDQASEISRSRVEQLLQKQLAADRLLALKEEGKDLDIDQAVALALESKIA